MHGEGPSITARLAGGEVGLPRDTQDHSAVRPAFAPLLCARAGLTVRGAMSPELDPSERALVADVTRLVAAARAVRPSDPVPCFALLRVRSRGRDRDYLLGAETVVTPGVTVLHWQTAPLAEVFFGCTEGADYEL